MEQRSGNTFSWLADHACNDRIHNNPDSSRPELATHISPLAQAKSGNRCAIAIWAFLTQIGKQTSTLPNHQQQPSPRMEIMFMNLKMLGQLIDTPRENGDLYLG